MVATHDADVLKQTPAKGSSEVAWFCVRSHNKHEHIAAAYLRRCAMIEVFFPRIRLRRACKHGSFWMTEALFPNYLFARFDRGLVAQVHYAPGVSGVVHFGVLWPAIPDQIINDLRQRVGGEQVFVFSSDLRLGDQVQITAGVLRGLSAVVTRVMTGHERVRVLMDFLGRQTSVELHRDSVIKNDLISVLC
jgi:transcriptional antiterminator RfaH